MEDMLNQIERYINNQLNATEKKAFEQALQDDKKLAEEFALYQSLMGGIRLKNNKDLKKRLNEIHEQAIKTKTKTTAISRSLMIGIAAAIALLIIGFFLFNTDSTDTNAIYLAYYDPYEPDWDNRGDTNNIGLQQIKQLYEREQYKALPEAIENIQVDTYHSLQLIMINGIANLENENYSEAQKYFSQFSENNVFYSEAQWYLALSYLKEGKREEAKSIFQKIATDKNADYYKEAKEILQKI